MLLLDLPAELLTSIVSETIPDGFESFVLSCKTILHVGRQFFAHYKLIKQYQNFSYQKGVRSIEGWIIRTPQQLLYEIARRPQIAETIIWADLRGPLPEVYPDVPELHGNEDQKWWDWVYLRPVDELSSVFRRASFLAGWDVDVSTLVQNALDDINHYAEYMGQYTGPSTNYQLDGSVPRSFREATIALVALLPNLRSLATTKTLCSSSNAANIVIQQLIERSDLPVSVSDEHRPLHCLQEVHPSWPRGDQMRHHIFEFESILALRSLQVFIQASVMAMNEVTAHTWTISPQSHFPGIREIVLWASVIGPYELHRLVWPMPRLEICRLEQTTKWEGGRDEEAAAMMGSGWGARDQGWEMFDPGQIVRYLTHDTGRRLKGLGLTIDFNVGPCVSAIQDLKGFKKLEELELSCNVFFSDWVESMTEEEEREEIRARIPRLIDILPPSLRRMRLKTANDAVSAEKRRHGLSGLLNGFGESATALPVLEVVEIVPDPEAEAEKVPDSEGEDDEDKHNDDEANDDDDAGERTFPDDFYDADILKLVAGLDKVCFREAPGFKFMTLQRSPPSWFQSGGYGT